MKQIRVALMGAFLLLLCTADIGLAEGEDIPPPDTGTTAVVTERSTSPDRANTDSGAEDEATLVPPPEALSEATEESLPKLEAWRPIVNGLHPGYWDTSVLPVQGVAMYYNPGVFDQVLDFRFQNGHISECEDCIGYVALLRAGDIDRQVWLQRAGEMPEGPFWVVDVAAGKDIPRLLSKNWVVDVDHDTAMRWQMAGPVPITVYDTNSAEALAAREARASAAQTVALMGIVYKCAIVPLETHNYQMLDVLAASATCLTTPEPDSVPTPVHTEATSN